MSDLIAKIRRLGEAGKALNSGVGLKKLCQQIVDLVAETLGVEFCSLYLKKDFSLLVLAARCDLQIHSELEELKIGQGLAGWVAERDEPILVTDATADSEFPKGTDGALSLMAMPLKYNESLIGVLDVESSKKAAFSESDLELLQIFANQAATVIQATLDTDDNRARIIGLKARADRQELIYQIGLTYIQGQTLKAAMKNVVDIVATGLHYSQTAVLLLDSELEELEVISAYGYGEIEGLHIPVSQGATGYAVRHRESVVIPDVTTDPRYVQGIRRGRSELVVPIICQDELYGVIDVESPVLDAFDQEDVQLLNIVASYASAAINAAKQEEHLEAERSIREHLQLEVKLLSTVSQTLSSIDDDAAFFQEVLRLVDEIFRWQDTAIWVIERESGQLIVDLTRGEVEFEIGTQIQMGNGVVGLAARSSKSIIDRKKNNKENRNDPIKERPEMAVPLWDGHETNRVLHVLGSDAGFASSDLNLLTAFSNQVSNAFTAMRLRGETKQQIKVLDNRTRRLDLLIRVARSLTSRMTIENLLDELLRFCIEAFDLSVCAVLLLDSDKQNLLRKASVGYDDDAPTILAVGQGITGHVAAMGVPLLVTDVTKDKRYIAGLSGSRSEMAAPLVVFGDVIGVLDAESIEKGAFDEEDLDLFTCFASQAAVAIHSADLAAKIERSESG
ncbi:MAG: GAF domain-containing protein [Proteobacteria bacterium]|nr:GAF domain-containing protein [Pseudomonadota bacterium]